MPRTAIVTDSTTYIPQDLVKKYGIYVAPQQIIWGTETFRDGVDMSPTQFYERLKNDKENPKTSQASPGTFKELFSEALKSADPKKGVIINFISGGVSKFEVLKEGGE